MKLWDGSALSIGHILIPSTLILLIIKCFDASLYYSKCFNRVFMNVVDFILGGDLNEVLIFNCIVDVINWTTWSEWSTCHCTGTGTSIRERSCVISPCTGTAVEERECQCQGKGLYYVFIESLFCLYDLCIMFLLCLHISMCYVFILDMYYSMST